MVVSVNATVSATALNPGICQVLIAVRTRGGLAAATRVAANSTNTIKLRLNSKLEIYFFAFLSFSLSA